MTLIESFRRTSQMRVDGIAHTVLDTQDAFTQIRVRLSRDGADYRFVVSKLSGDAKLQELNPQGYCTTERDVEKWSVKA